ncbi:MAG: DNA-binding protein [Proteobacteria bacterium]|nr:MAG: DNA-binding protein [Pseudomonadota bacterium]
MEESSSRTIRKHKVAMPVVNSELDRSLITEAFVRTKEAAAFLGISEGELRNKVSCGTVPYYKLGRSNRYLRSELIGLLKPKGVRNGN